MREVLGFVRVDQDAAQNCRTIKAIKAFQAGEVVLRELPLVVAQEDSDIARIHAYLQLGRVQREDFADIMPDLELRHRGFALADAVDLAPYEEVRAAIQKEHDEQCEAKGVMALGIVTTLEVASILIKWRALSKVSPKLVFKVASKLLHSCASHVELHIYPESGLSEVTARRNIPPQTRIGQWMLKDTQLWWKSAALRGEAIKREGLFNGQCRCERCDGPDVVRALTCPSCEIGEVFRNGKTKRWSCTRCDFSGSDKIMVGYMETEVTGDHDLMIAVEKNLSNVLTNKEKLSNVQLQEFADRVCAQLSFGHFLYAMAIREMYFRSVRSCESGEASFSSVLYALRFMEWVLSRHLGIPPQDFADELFRMGIASLRFLHERIHGVRDLRTVYVKAVRLVRELLEEINCSSKEEIRRFQGAAVNLRRSCAYCRKRLPEEPEEEVEWDLPLGDEDGGVVTELSPVVCACGVLRYCDLSCQTADSRRHRPYCVRQKTEFFRLRSVAEILVPA
eukprot:TRINITY_DN30092_c0_g1_i1.p1 TRINITY_DN30092_c0_g1~~TRINITY_DN30092_c0_g1_i1.p1  ORF type:complete len:528 (+),score=82.23 TRINITY_DN30092_c0_g1_i1:66-1586(+)